MEWLQLAGGLATYRDIATAPLILASIYRGLREATIESINLNKDQTCCSMADEPEERLLLALKAWWDHYQGRFGAIEAAYKNVFEGCPFCPELGKREKQALLTQIAKDNKLPMIVDFCLLFVVGTSYQTFCPASKLATEKGKATSEGSGSVGPKAPIFVQRKRNLVKIMPSVFAVAKAASPSKASMPDSIPEITQSKRARTSPAKTPESTTAGPRYSFKASYLLIPSPPSSPLAPVASSSPIPNVGEVLPKETAGAGEVEPHSERAQTWIYASVVLRTHLWHVY
ncbi:unnamed protein product [Prunus armeniaca]|uniref:Aminotransferase-like plant mobile domain-containing protein n=1 Tax=Prunus armeniaca TaxID=36596 RepID=A0A6J5URI3_PRUAR|nr:unnamed protein product [Prunus armeniaca]